MQLWAAVDRSWRLLRLRQAAGLGQRNGTSLAGRRKLATSAARRTAKHSGTQLQEACHQRDGVSRDTVDPVLDEQDKRAVLCLGRVLSDRHVNVEFSKDDAVCCTHGPNRPITNHAQLSQRLAVRARDPAWPVYGFTA
jgi:hypothetical protein